MALIQSFNLDSWSGLLRTVAAGLLVGGGGFWVPRVVRHYGTTYFDDLTAAPRRISILAVVLGELLLTVAATRLSPLALPGLSLMIVALIGVIHCDFRYQVIPDRFQCIGAAGAGLFTLAGVSESASSFPSVLFEGVVGIGITASLYIISKIYSLARKREALGLGDIKLLTWLGVVFGPRTMAVLAVGLALGFVAVVPQVVRGKIGRHSAFAFGPYLVFGAVAVFAWTLTGTTQ